MKKIRKLLSILTIFIIGIFIISCSNNDELNSTKVTIKVINHYENGILERFKIFKGHNIEYDSNIFGIQGDIINDEFLQITIGSYKTYSFEVPDDYRISIFAMVKDDIGGYPAYLKKYSVKADNSYIFYIKKENNSYRIDFELTYE